MIKVVLVRLDGSAGDEFRLEATESLATLFGAHVIGLFLNVLPAPSLVEPSLSLELWTGLMEQAREEGRKREAILRQRLSGLGPSTEMRRYDVYEHERALVTARECRIADVFVGLRLSDVDKTVELHDVIEEVLFQSGRHLFLAADQRTFDAGFEHAMIAWNGSREAARAVTEALPYLEKSLRVTVLFIERGGAPPSRMKDGYELVTYLGRHGINAMLRIVDERGSDFCATLIAETVEGAVDLLVMGGYGHARLREWLLGGITYRLLRKSSVSLVIAH
ncbi:MULTISPECIES: universal stress protein [unclassified Sinorhizobium]|uniref:universal stress protein n=1 Tax=unclassified Sinorhizobium TaxID=2613772 RepID=UPI003525075D